MKVLFIAPYPIEGASTRHRIASYFGQLDKEGIKYKLSPFMTEYFYKIVYRKGMILSKIFLFLLGTLRRFFDILRCPFYDALFIHLHAFPLGTVFFERCFKLFNGNVIYDLDDAIFLNTTSSANKFLSRLKSGRKFEKIIKMSRAVISCNDYLKNYSISTSEKPINITIHTPVDTDKFKPAEKKGTGLLTLGWVGSFTTGKYLELIYDVLSEISREYDFQFNVVGAGKEIEIANVKINNIPWTLEKDVENFQILDIGLYPLPDDDWVKGKTGFKTMQYMAVGIPCIVSNVGSNRTIIEDGVNGFLVNDRDEWYEKLSLLMKDENLRSRLGKAGRKTVEEKYSVKANAKRFIEIMENICHG